MMARYEERRSETPMGDFTQTMGTYYYLSCQQYGQYVHIIFPDQCFRKAFDLHGPSHRAPALRPGTNLTAWAQSTVHFPGLVVVGKHSNDPPSGDFSPLQ